MVAFTPIIKRIIGINLLVLLILNLPAQNTISIQKALQLAKLNNPNLKVAYFNMAIIQADIITAKLRPNPTLNNQTLQLMQPSLFPANSSWNNAQNRLVWWQLTKSFQIAGQRKNKITLAQSNSSLAQKNYNETERNVYLDVANKWVEVWAIQRQLTIIETAKANIDSLIVISRLRLKNQVITQTDLMRTELLGKQYGIQLKSTGLELKAKIKELKLLLGIDYSFEIDTASIFNYNNVLAEDSLIKQSLTSRSDIETSKLLMEVSESNIKLQKSLAYPQPELGLIWNPQNTVPYFGVFATVDLPFFNRNQGEISKASVLKQQAQMEFNMVQQKIKTEISNAYNYYVLQQQNVQTYKEVLAQSQMVLDNVKYAYLKGGTTIIDFLEAQRSWLETQQQYYNAEQLYKQSYVQLLYTSGLINQMAQ